MSEPRYTRQARLAEVGERGQAKLCGAEATIACDGTAGAIAARYAAGAGFGALRVRSEEASGAAIAVDARIRVVRDEGLVGPLLPSWFDLQDPAARDVARGAYEALVAVRAHLDIEIAVRSQGGGVAVAS